MFITVWKEKFSTATRTCSARDYCHTEQTWKQNLPVRRRMPIYFSRRDRNRKRFLTFWTETQSVWHVTSQLGQLSLPSLRGSRYMRTSFGWESKGRYSSFRSWINTCMGVHCAGNSVRSLDNVCHTRVLPRWVSLRGAISSVRLRLPLSFLQTGRSDAMDEKKFSQWMSAASESQSIEEKLNRKTPVVKMRDASDQSWRLEIPTTCCHRYDHTMMTSQSCETVWRHNYSVLTMT